MEACSSYFLPRLIGLSRAMYLTTTGSTYPTSHPLLNELFSEVLPTPEETLARALELAEDIAKNTSNVSININKALMHHGAESAEGAHLLVSKVLAGLFGQKDNSEGVKSFLEKRLPRFRGKMPPQRISLVGTSGYCGQSKNFERQVEALTILEPIPTSRLVTC